jgi:hypothetical protein
MLLYVHSAGRGHLPLPTLDTLLQSNRSGDVRLVLQHKDCGNYAEHISKLPHLKSYIVLPPNIKRLSPTRQWILENSPETSFVLFDDDLVFATRRKDDYTKFLPAGRAGVNRMLNYLDYLLVRYAHVGLMAREGGNRVPVDAHGKPVTYLEATRMMRVLGYNRSLMPADARFDRVPTKQDFDMTLQLLRAGLPNAVITEFVHNQAGSNTAGGCSAYRDAKMMEVSANKLAKLHPGFVKVVTKTTKSSWGGGERVDVQVAWKKALASAK